MISLLDNGILFNNVEINLGMSEKDVVEKVNINKDKIVTTSSNISYFKVDSIKMYELSGICRFMFREQKLFKITIVPSLKEYIRELDTVTRQGLYACVDKGFKYWIDCINKEGMFNKGEEDGFYTQFESTFMIITVSKDRDQEGVSMSLKKKI